MNHINHHIWVKTLNNYYNNQELPVDLVDSFYESYKFIQVDLEYKEELIFRDTPISIEFDNLLINNKPISNQNDFDFKTKWLEFLPPLVNRQNAFCSVIS